NIMTASTKKGLIIVAAVVLIGGGIIGVYYYRKRNVKKKPEEKNASDNTEPPIPSPVPSANPVKTTAHASTPAPKANNAQAGKGVYAIYTGEPVRKIPYPTGEIYFKATRAKKLGTFTGKVVNGFVQFNTGTGQL